MQSLLVNKSAELITESGPHCNDISAPNTAGVSCFSLQIHFFWTLLNSLLTCFVLQLNNRLFWQHMLVDLCVLLMFLYIPHVLLVSFSLHVISLNLVPVFLLGPLFLSREVPLLWRNCWLLIFLVCLPMERLFLAVALRVEIGSSWSSEAAVDKTILPQGRGAALNVLTTVYMSVLQPRRFGYTECFCVHSYNS